MVLRLGPKGPGWINTRAALWQLLRDFAFNTRRRGYFDFFVNNYSTQRNLSQMANTNVSWPATLSNSRCAMHWHRLQGTTHHWCARTPIVQSVALAKSALSYRIACALDQLLYLHASLEVNIRKSASFDPHVIWDPTCHKFSDLLMLLSTRSTAIFRRPDARNLCLRRCSSSRHPPDSRVLTGWRNDGTQTPLRFQQYVWRA